jgi:ABC-type transport system involved in Fe-S cluster assembly fused permease/ATPase subunit
MAAESGTHTALAVLHYIAPVVTTVYFVSAKTFSTCLLQEPSARAGAAWRRRPAIALQFSIVVTLIAEGLSAILHAIQRPGWYASQDYVIYLVLLFILHSSLCVSIVETAAPIWHPYLGAWLVALIFEIPLFVLHAAVGPAQDGFANARMLLSAVRAAAFLFMALTTAWFSLQDRRSSVKLDDESEALLALNGDENGLRSNRVNGQTMRKTDSARLRDDSSLSDDDSDDDDDPEFDSDSEDLAADKKMKVQSQKRLKESGSWLNYLKDFKIFFWILLPRKDRLVQACFVIIGIIMVIERALTILVPRQLGIITNELTNSAGSGQVPWNAIGVWMVLAALDSDAGLHLIKSIAQIPVENYGYKMLCTTAFRHIMCLSMDFHNDKNSGELIRAIEQGSNLQDLVDFLIFEVIPTLFDGLLAFVYVTILFDIYMAMIPLAVGFLYVYSGAKVTSWSVKQRRDYNTAWRNESKVQNEAINNWPTVSHFNRGNYEANRYDNTVDVMCKANWRYYVAYHCGAGAQSTVLFIGRLAATSLAAYRVAQGSAPVGSFITLVTYWSSIEAPLSRVSYSIRKISSMVIDSERMLQLLTTIPSVADATDAKEITVSRGEVEFDHVDFHYDERKPTLQDITFTAKPGQTIALVGETGGGKSTILKLLYRHYDVAHGAIRIDGQDLRSVTLDSLRDTFGMVPQDPSLFNVSIRDNIRYARLDATDDDIHAACRAAAIHDKILSFPDGYDATVGERGVKLSGGELQRLAIARAILRRPRIVLLDEATSMIDAETEAVIQRAFRNLSRDRTTFIVAHRLSTIQHADLILVVRDGRIVERGTHEELFRRRGGMYMALWSNQLSREVKDVGAMLDRGEEDEDEEL